MPAVVRILLVRHGESTWNAEARWQGQADPPLSPLGRQQAVAAALALPPVDLLAASDLERARTTAELLGATAGCGPVLVESGLRERDAGAFSGLTRAEIHERYPGALPGDPARAPGTEGDGLVPPEGWEPDDELSARAWAALDRLVGVLGERGGTTAVAVSHSGLIYAVERRFDGSRLRIANLEGRWFHHDHDGWRLGERHLLIDPERVAVTRPDAL